MTSDGWTRTTIGSLGKVITGRTPPLSHPEFWGNQIPFLTPSDMDDSRTITNFQRFISAKGASEMKRTVIPYGVAVSCIGWQMGKSSFINRPVLTNQQINTIIYDRELVDGLFLYYSLSSRRKEFFRLGSGGSRTPILKKSLFERIEVHLPPLQVQRAIARILGALDDKIELNREINQTLEMLAQSLFKAWFVDFDPVIAKATGRKPYGMNEETAALFPDTFEDSSEGAIPKGWQLKPLDEIAHYENGLALQNFRPEGDESLPVIKIRELRQGFSDSSSEKASPHIKASCIIDDGDVVFSWSGSLLVEIWCGGKGALNQHLFKVTSAKYPKWFYYFWTKEHLEDFQDIASGKATTMGHIQRHHLSAAQTAVPSDGCLARADRMLAPLINNSINNQVQSRTLITLRDVLLPKLLSGEISVRQTERLVAEAV